MKAVFAHDNRFIPHDGRVLSEAHFASEGWERYLRVFDELLVVARRSEMPPGKRPEDLNVSSRPGVGFRFVPNLASAVAQLTRRREALAIMSECVAEADAVIARLPSETGQVAIRAAREHVKPCAVEVTACPWDALWNYGTWQAKAYALVRMWGTRQAVARAEFVTYVTREFLQGRYPNHHGYSESASDVEIELLPPTVLQTRLRQPSHNGKVVFGLIGTLRGKFKGIQTALASFAAVRNDLPPFELRVLGGGDAEPWKGLASKFGLVEAVHFDGVLPSGEPVMRWLDQVHVYLQPSFQEGLPRALIEAMSRGCPAIGSTAGGIPELLDADCLHRPGDVRLLASLLVRAARDRGWRAREATRNFEKAKEYTKDVLEPRRQAFWERFAGYTDRQRQARYELA